MDPQKISQLDPKLREAYQRVMGASVPKPQAAPAAPPQPTPTSINKPPQPASQAQPAINPQPQTTPNPQSASQNSPPPATNFEQMHSEVSSPTTSPNFTSPQPQAETVSLKKKSSLMPILIGIIFLVFIAVYALFWTKFFNFKNDF